MVYYRQFYYHNLHNHLNHPNDQVFPPGLHLIYLNFHLDHLRLSFLGYNDALGAIALTTPNQRVLNFNRRKCRAESLLMMVLQNFPEWLAKEASELYIYERLAELEEQLGLSRNYDPSCVGELHGAIRSFSA